MTRPLRIQGIKLEYNSWVVHATRFSAPYSENIMGKDTQVQRQLSFRQRTIPDRWAKAVIRCLASFPSLEGELVIAEVR